MRENWKRSAVLSPPIPPARRFQLVISYYGPAHYGWQRQDSESVEDRSVQSFLEKAIFKISGERSNAYGSGRTDSGVHALGQCAHFDSSCLRMDEETLRRALNANLPETIRINGVTERFDAFHARFSTLLREYEYVLKDDVHWTPFDNGRAWRLRNLPDISTLNEMQKFLIGEDVDFRAFDFTKSNDGHSQKRDVLKSRFERRGDSLVFTITGNAFLYHMVRAIVGMSVSLALKHDRKDAVSMFSGLMRPELGIKADFIAPAQGLYLKRVIYDEEEYLKFRSAMKEE